MFHFIKCPFVVLSATYVKLVQKKKKKENIWNLLNLWLLQYLTIFTVLAIIRCKTKSNDQQQISPISWEEQKKKKIHRCAAEPHHFLKIDQTVDKCFVALMSKCHV